MIGVSRIFRENGCPIIHVVGDPTENGGIAAEPIPGFYLATCIRATTWTSFESLIKNANRISKSITAREATPADTPGHFETTSDLLGRYQIFTAEQTCAKKISQAKRDSRAQVCFIH